MSKTYFHAKKVPKWTQALGLKLNGKARL